MQKKVSFILTSFIVLSLVIFFAKNSLAVHFFQSVIQTVFLPGKLLLTSKTGNSNGLEKLKEENIKLTEKIVNLEILKKDDQALRQQFQETSVSTQKLLPARVIGYVGSYSSPNVLIINKGKSSGVRTGSAVVFGKNLVGKIGDVNAKYSSVILPYNSGFTTVGKTLKDALGLVRGQDNFILFDKVVIGEVLSKGDIVVTKGDVNNAGVGVQSDLIVGKIESIEKIETKPFQNAKVESLLDFTKLSMVFILL